MPKEKKYFSKEEIENMGAALIKAYVEAGNTVVTSKDGADTLSKMELLESYKEQIEEFKVKLTQMKAPKKPKHKYPSNYTPSKNRYRKK